MIYETSITAKNYSTALDILLHEVDSAGLFVNDLVWGHLEAGLWADVWIKPTEPIYKSADMVYEFEFKLPVTRKVAAE